MKLLVLDTETTGLDLTKHEIIQIGFLFVDISDDNRHSFSERREINIRPLRLEEADPNALKVNNFSAYLWKDSLPFTKHVDFIKEKIESADILLGQNLIFDLKFIKQTYANLELESPKFPPYMDTKWMATQLLKEGKVKSTSMDKLCKHFNITFSGKAHTALADCERTYYVWLKLSETVKDAPIFTFINNYDPYANKT